MFYDTAKPYNLFEGLKSIIGAIGADSGSSPETYNRANHQGPTSWFGALHTTIPPAGSY